MVRCDGSRPRWSVLVLMAVAGLVAAGPGCASSDSADDTSPIGTSPATASDALPADGATTTTVTIGGPPSIAPDVSVTAGGSGQCRAAGLAVSVEEDGAEAGHQHRRIVVTNTGAQPCTITGYPGVALRSAAGQPVGAPAAREDVPVATVTLAPGASASATVDQSSPGVFPAQACGQPVMASSLQVIIPDDTEPVVVAAPSEACPLGVAQLTVRPFQAGRDSQP